jgi:hypothetical protein
MIRTSDPLVPNQLRYQAALHPDEPRILTPLFLTIGRWQHRKATRGLASVGLSWLAANELRAHPLSDNSLSAGFPPKLSPGASRSPVGVS